jgi:hypothetical protein
LPVNQLAAFRRFLPCTAMILAMTQRRDGTWTISFRKDSVLPLSGGHRSQSKPGRPPVRLISTSWFTPGVRAHRLQPPSVSHSRWIQACLQHLLDFSHQYSVSSEYLSRRAKSVSDSYYQSQELSRQQPQELLGHQPQPAYFQRILSPSHLIRQASGPLDV